MMDQLDTLAAAQVELRKNFDVGSTCPACGQFVKQYKRKLYSTMARLLIAFYKLNAIGYIHVTDIIRMTGLVEYRCGDWAKLSYWGLIQEKEINRDQEPVKDTKNSGYWMITDLGKDFVEGKTKVYSHALVYNQKCRGLVGTKVSIKECLGKKFSYSELMGR